MGLDVDDTNSAIQYSSGWTNRPASQQHQGTGHATSQTGASLTFTFEGTAIRMICTVPSGHDLYSRAQVVLDGGSPRLLEHTTHPSDFYNDQWYDSGSLSSGRHTITVTNPGGSSAAPFVLDKFNIDGTVANVNPPAAAPTTTTSTRREVITSTQVVTATRVTTTDAVISGSTTRVSTLVTSSSTSTAVPTAESSASASSPTDSQPTQSSAEKTVTAVQFLTTSTAADGSVSTQTSIPSTNDPTSAAATSAKPLGLIIGSVLGGIAVILLFLLLLICIRRRNRTHILLPDDREARPSRHRDTAVTPFNMNRSDSGASRSGDLTANNSNTGHTRSSESANDHPPYTAGAVGAAYLARNNSEKSGHLYLGDSPTSLYSPSAHPANNPFTAPPVRLPATHNTPITLPHLDTGGGPSLARPSYMSGETVMMSSSDIYLRTPALGPVDSRDVPPAYQSVRNANSGASFPPFAASALRDTQGAG